MHIFDMRARAPWPPVKAIYNVTILRTALAWWYRGIEMPSTVRCRRRPGRRACPGRLRILLRDSSEPIRWRCDACGSRGEIHNWFRPDGGPWPRNSEGVRGQADWVEARIPAAAHERLLRSCERMVRLGVERVLRAGTMAGAEVTVGGPRLDMEALCLFAWKRRHAARTIQSAFELEAAAESVTRALRQPPGPPLHGRT